MRHICLLLLMFICIYAVSARLCTYATPCGHNHHFDIGQVNHWNCSQEDSANVTVHQPLHTDDVLLINNCTSLTNVILTSSTPLNYSTITVGSFVSLQNTSVRALELVIDEFGTYMPTTTPSHSTFLNVSRLNIKGYMTINEQVSLDLDVVNVSGTFLLHSHASFSYLIVWGGDVTITRDISIRTINVYGSLKLVNPSVLYMSRTKINNYGTLILRQWSMQYNDSSSIYNGPQSMLTVYGVTQVPITLREATLIGIQIDLTNFTAYHSTIQLTPSAGYAQFRGHSKFIECNWVTQQNTVYLYDIVMFNGTNHLQDEVFFGGRCILNGTLNVFTVISRDMLITAVENADLLIRRTPDDILNVNVTGHLQIYTSTNNALAIDVQEDSELHITRDWDSSYTKISSVNGGGKCVVDLMATYLLGMDQLYNNNWTIRELNVSMLSVQSAVYQVNFTAENASVSFGKIDLYEISSDDSVPASTLKMKAMKGDVFVERFGHMGMCNDVRVPEVGVKLRNWTATAIYAPSALKLTMSEDGNSVIISNFNGCLRPKVIVMKDLSNNQTWTAPLTYYWSDVQWTFPLDISPCSSNFSMHSESEDVEGPSTYFQILPRIFLGAINVTHVNVTYNSTGVAIKWDPETFTKDVRCGFKPTQISIKTNYPNYYPSQHTNISDGFIFMTPLYQPECQMMTVNISLIYGTSTYKTSSTKAAGIYYLSSYATISKPTDDLIIYDDAVEVQLTFPSFSCAECTHMVKLDGKVWSSKNIVKAVISNARNEVYKYKSWPQCENIVAGDVFEGYILVQKPMDMRVVVGIVAAVVSAVAVAVVVVVIVVKKMKARAAAERAPLLNSNRSSNIENQSEMPEDDGALISPVASPPPILRASQEIS